MFLQWLCRSYEQLMSDHRSLSGWRLLLQLGVQELVEGIMHQPPNNIATDFDMSDVTDENLAKLEARLMGGCHGSHTAQRDSLPHADQALAQLLA
jgi:hypothetical protein